MWKKNKRHYRSKIKIQTIFQRWKAIFIIDKLTRDIIECKLAEAIKLRKNLGYNHDNIMVREVTSIAQKIIKLFPNENIVLNKNFNNRKPDTWFKNHNLITEVDEGNHGNYDSDDEKEREDMFKKHSFNIFQCNPNDPNFDLFKFLRQNKFAHIKITIVAVTKLKELKRYAKNLLPNYKKWKTQNQK